MYRYNNRKKSKICRKTEHRIVIGTQALPMCFKQWYTDEDVIVMGR